LRIFIQHFSTKKGFGFLSEFVEALPTAELEPITENYTQSDEVDMGMTYAELSVFGRLRKMQNLGPVEMFCRLLSDWSDTLSPSEVIIKPFDLRLRPRSKSSFTIMESIDTRLLSFRPRTICLLTLQMIIGLI
jgi:NH3-dependent NAD+ synthetase